MLNLILLVDMYHIIYNIYIIYPVSSMARGDQNPIIPKGKISFTQLQVNYFDFLELLCSETGHKHPLYKVCI